MHNPFGGHKKKNKYKWLWCSAAVLAAFVFRMPSLAAHTGTVSLRQEPQLSAVQENGAVSCERFLREEGTLCFVQASLTEEKQNVSPVTRRTQFRFLPKRELQQQSRFECRIPVSKPKFLIPPSGRLIVGRYIRANPSVVL